MYLLKKIVLILFTAGVVVYFILSGNTILHLVALAGGIIGLILGIVKFLYAGIDENIFKRNSETLDKISFILILFISLFLMLKQGNEYAIKSLIICSAACILLKESMELILLYKKVSPDVQHTNNLKASDVKNVFSENIIVVKPVFRIISGISSVICFYFIYLFTRIFIYMYTLNILGSWSPLIWLLNFGGLLFFLVLVYICLVTTISTVPPKHIIHLFHRISIDRFIFCGQASQTKGQVSS
jgi:hypothetical protein